MESEYNTYLNKKEKEKDPNNTNYKSPLYDGKNVYLSDTKNSDNIKVNYNVTEYENDLNCIYIDLIMKYYRMYRMYIKSGEGILEK